MPGRADYEERKENRKNRYAEKADKAIQSRNTHYKNHDVIASTIPFGQPILVGHHSENKHRRDISRMDSEMRKGAEQGEKAAYYQERIDSIENNKSISSDDPKALQKLKDRLKGLEKLKENVKAREHEDWELPNINVTIRTTKKRIAEIEKIESLTFETIKFTDGEIIHNKEINRIQIIFDSIPDEKIRTILKHHGFKWSRNEGAWQRLFNENTIYIVKVLIREGVLINNGKTN